MIIKPIHITKVAEDVYNRDGSLWIPKGSNLSYCSVFETKKFGKFSLTAPNPVHLILSTLDKIIDEMKKEEFLINKSNKIRVFSKLNDGVNKYNTDELLRLDPDATQERVLESERLYKYLGLAFNCLTAMVSSLEAFVNQELPNDAEFKHERKNKIFKKKKIETELSLKAKINLLGLLLERQEYVDESFWPRIEIIIKLRNDIVHLKTKGSEIVSRNDALFKDVLEFDFLEMKNAVSLLLNYFIKDYVS